MKITDVEAFVLQAPGRYEAPKGSEEAYGIRYTGIIKVSTDEGIFGVSDVESQPHVIRQIILAPPSGSGMFEGLRHILVGEDPFEVERLWEKMYTATIYYGRRGAAIQAISAVDIALWDIIGRATGRPIHKLLGGAYRTEVKAYASTLFRPTPQDMRDAVKGYLDQGFRAIKFGWGPFGQDEDLDVRLVEAARQAAGDKVDLLLDWGWTVHRTAKEAIRLARQLAPFRPFWIEEPLHPEHYDAYRRLAEAVDIPIAAGEQEATLWGFEQLMHRGGVDILQPDLTRCGGLTVARKIAAMAEAHGRLVCPHAWVTDLLTAASLHFNAFLRRSLFVEYNVTSGPLSRDLIRTPLRLNDDGTIDVPQGPGLGVEVNWEAVGRYAAA